MIPSKIVAYVLSDPKKQTFTKTQITVPAIGPNDVLLNVEYCGVCHTDFYCPVNKAPGHEFVGVAVAIGNAVKKIKVGDRVGGGWQYSSCNNCQACMEGNENTCPSKQNFTSAPTGGFSEYVVWDASFLYLIPDSISSADAGPLLCAGVTVFAPLRNYNVQPGSRVGILGIGGLGHLGIKFAKAWGCRVVALSTSPDKENEARKFGADEFVVTKDEKQLKSLKPLDMIINTVSASLPWETYINLLGQRGKFIMLGIVKEPISVSGGSLILQERSISGSLVGSPLIMQKMLQFVDQHKIAPQKEIYNMNVEGCQTAFKRIDKNVARYRIVLKNVNFSPAKKI